MAKFGVLVLNFLSDDDLADGIYLFDSEEEAEAWQVQVLVDNQEAERVPDVGGWRLSGSDEIHETPAELIFALQDQLESLEYFHLYRIRNA